MFKNYNNNNATIALIKTKLVDNHKKWKIEKILNVKSKVKKIYRVKWKKYSLCDNEWFLKKKLKNVSKTITKFKRKQNDI